MSTGGIWLFRVVVHDPPAPEDFQSDASRGVIPETPPHPGSMSAWGTLPKARDLVKWLLRTGRQQWAAIARVWVAEPGPFGCALDEPPSRQAATMPCGETSPHLRRQHRSWNSGRQTP